LIYTIYADSFGGQSFALKNSYLTKFYSLKLTLTPRIHKAQCNTQGPWHRIWSTQYLWCRKTKTMLYTAVISVYFDHGWVWQ